MIHTPLFATLLALAPTERVAPEASTAALTTNPAGFEASLDVVTFVTACAALKTSITAKERDGLLTVKTPAAGATPEARDASTCWKDEYARLCGSSSWNDLVAATKQVKLQSEVLRRAVRGQPAVCGSTDVNVSEPYSAPALFGASWQDAVIRGAAAFLVKRAKAEAVAYVLRLLKGDLCERGNSKQFLPASCAVLAASDTGDDLTIWVSLKAAVELDLAELPLRLFHQLGAAEPSLLALESFAEVVRDIQGGENFVYVLTRLKTTPIQGRTSDLLYAVGLAVNLAGGKLDTELDPEEEALFARVAALKFSTEMNARGRILGALCPVNGDSGSSCGLENSMQTLRRALVQAHKAQGDANSASFELRDAAYSRYLRALAPVFAQTARLLSAPAKPPEACAANDPDRDTRLFVLLSASSATLIEVLDGARSRDYSTMLAALLQTSDQLCLTKSLPAWVTKYGNLLAHLATVKTSEDMQKLLETVAAPAGSYHGKRGNPRWIARCERDESLPYRMTLALNAYVGFQAGGEILRRDGLDRQGLAGRVGLFAPVGLELSRGLRRRGSIGGFVSVIDLGALVDYRVAKEPAATDTAAGADNSPNVTFAQVVSPGLFTVLAIPGVPVALGVGLAYTPKLRSVLVGGEKDDNPVDALRFGGFLAVDIPIFILVRGGKPKSR